MTRPSHFWLFEALWFTVQKTSGGFSAKVTPAQMPPPPLFTQKHTRALSIVSFDFLIFLIQISVVLFPEFITKLVKLLLLLTHDICFSNWLQVTDLTKFLIEHFEILGENIPNLLDTDEGTGSCCA